MRRNEVLGLRWSNIDEAQGCFHIMQQLASREANKATGEVLAELKEDHSLWTLPITDVASIYFERQKARRNASVNSNFIVCRENGQPLSEGHISCDFNKLLKELGLPYCRFHDLRHAAAKNMHQLCKKILIK